MSLFAPSSTIVYPPPPSIKPKEEHDQIQIDISSNTTIVAHDIDHPILEESTTIALQQDQLLPTPLTAVTNTNRTKNCSRCHHQHNPKSTTPTAHYRKRSVICCCFCKRRTVPNFIIDIGPYLIHRTTPNLITLCPCLNRQAHLICLKIYNDHATLNCNVCPDCNYIYKSSHYIRFAQFLNIVCHLLSLASAVGLIFGLSFLGKALDELGLGSEFGPKLDGDETWQDRELLDIVQWLNVVHYATGCAGEALLGLVYMVGVCLLIGVDRTLVMLSNILYIRLDLFITKPTMETTGKKKKRKRAVVVKDWMNRGIVFLSLLVLGLLLGTYLLFFSWIWASVLHHLKTQVVNFNGKGSVAKDNSSCSEKVSQPVAPEMVV